MHLHVEPMDAVLVDFDDQGHVKFANEEWTTPSLQETRALLYAAEQQIATLQELVEALENAVAPTLKA